MKEYAFVLVNKRNNERQELFRWSKQEYTDIITRHIDVNKNVSLMSLNYIIYALNNYNVFLTYLCLFHVLLYFLYGNYCLQ